MVFLTAQAGIEARIESFEAGADDYLAKPFDENELTSRLKNLIRARDQEREIRKLQKEKLRDFCPLKLQNLVLDGEAYLAPRRTPDNCSVCRLERIHLICGNRRPEDVMKVLDEYQYVVWVD